MNGPRDLGRGASPDMYLDSALSCTPMRQEVPIRSAYNLAMLHTLDRLLTPALMARLTLWLNHVLGSESVATDRLRRHAGRTVQVALHNWPTLLPPPPSSRSASRRPACSSGSGPRRRRAPISISASTRPIRRC